MSRLRKIRPRVVESGEPKDGVFPDNLRLFKRIEGCETRNCEDANQTERWLKVKIHGRRSATWTRESELRDTVVKLFDRKNRETIQARTSEDVSRKDSCLNQDQATSEPSRDAPGGAGSDNEEQHS